MVDSPSPTTVHPAPSGYPWRTAGVLALVTVVLYGVLPSFAPSPISTSTDMLLLGVVLGIVVGICIRVDARTAPVVAMAATIAVSVRFLAAGESASMVLPIAVVIGLDVWAMAYLVQRSGAARFRRPQDVLILLLIAAVVGTLAGLLAASVFQLNGQTIDEFWHLFRAWVIDDVFGLVCIAPAFLTFHRPRLGSRSAVAEYAIVCVLTIGLTYAIFRVVTPGEQGMLGWPYLVILGPLWIAVRLGVQAVAPVIAVVAAFVTVSTADSVGPFAGASPVPLDRTVTAEVFATVIALTVLLLGLLRDDRLRSLEQVRESSRLLREVIDGANALVFAKSYQGVDAGRGRYVMVNSAWERRLGLSSAESLERSDDEIFTGEQARAYVANDRAVMLTGEPMTVQEEDLSPNGERRYYSSSKFPLLSDDGQPWGVGAIATDISDLVHAHERERRQADLLRAVFELSPTPAVRVARTADDGVKVLDANSAMCGLMGAPHGAIDQCDLLRQVHPDDKATVLDVLAYATRASSVGSMPSVRQRELRLSALDGRILWVLMSAAAVGPEAPNGATEIVAQFEDVTARRVAEEALSDQALRDAVTGLPNRRALADRVGSALQRLNRGPGAVAVLFCDLDRFKDINDSLGHQAGDLMLVEAAERLRSALRPEDTVARLGGDEFVALAEGMTDVTTAIQLAGRLQGRLGAPWSHNGQTFRPTMSVGIALTGDPETEVDELLRRADLAMYRAKDAGRDRIEVYEKSVDEEIQQAVAMQHDLRRAIDTGALVLHYQPIVDLSGGDVIGAEALVRMLARDGQLLPPGVFVPQAETSGLIVAMGAWVIRAALTELKSWRELGHQLTMSVNVSPSQLREEDFAGFVLDQAEYADVDPSWLSIEVTETALLHDPGRAAHELDVLSRAGIGISLDDFGTGYSSLSWLTQFPVDVVKIDRSFTDELGIDERKSAIVSALIQVSHELGFAVVAEGVETELQRDRLLALGCDRGQGYLFGRPVPPDEAPWV